MKRKSFEINLVFTRDLSLYLADYWHELVTKGFTKTFKYGLSDQITRFTSRTAETYRLASDMEKLKRKVLAWPLSHPFFQKTEHIQFRRRIEDLEELACIKPTDKKGPGAFEEAKREYSALYHQYVLALFLPGSWADEFKQKNGLKAKSILREFFDDRACAEGMLERLDAMARRYVAFELNKRKLPSALAPFVRQKEYDDMAAGKKSVSQANLEARRSGYVLAKKRLYIRQPFEKVIPKLGYAYAPSQIDLKQTEIKGMAVKRLGKVRGKVKIVLNNQEAKNFPAGWVLVTAMTTPDYLPAMKRARAVVTDEGGITSHAAIAGRELNIPAVIGTKIATKVFKDGDWVEVDTVMGVVTKAS